MSADLVPLGDMAADLAKLPEPQAGIPVKCGCAYPDDPIVHAPKPARDNPRTNRPPRKLSKRT